MRFSGSVAKLLDNVRVLLRLARLNKESPDIVRGVLDCYCNSRVHLEASLRAIVEKHEKFKSFWGEFECFDKLLDDSGVGKLNREDIYPCFDDKTTETAFDRHYIYHPAWAARMLARSMPTKHIDISSTLHFSSIVSAFVPVDFYDFRPAPLVLSNFNSAAADLFELPFDDNSILSLSCMHVIEHIGLGRYGDRLNVDGHMKAAQELVRVLAPFGQLIVAFPVGRSRIQFNAHRIFSHDEVLNMFSGLDLVEYSLIPDGAVENGMLDNPGQDVIDSQSYGCGCYLFTKRTT